MGCLCRHKKKKDLVYVRSLAIKAAIVNEQDYQIYTLIMPPIGEIYDFEPINGSRTTIVEIIH